MELAKLILHFKFKVSDASYKYYEVVELAGVDFKLQTSLKNNRNTLFS